VMSRDLTSKELIEIKDEICHYVQSMGYELEIVFRRYELGYYRHTYFKNRVKKAIYNALREELGKEASKGVSHAGYAYPQVNEVLRHMYDYKQYEKRNINENKNENSATGI